MRQSEKHYAVNAQYNDKGTLGEVVFFVKAKNKTEALAKSFEVFKLGTDFNGKLKFAHIPRSCVAFFL